MMNSIKYTKPGAFEEMRFEKIHNVIFQNSQEGSVIVANEIAGLIKKKQEKDEKCVLGLATGSSPIRVYEELIRLHIEEKLSFYNVVTFNLDEYYPMDKDNIQSYHHFMFENLFNHIDIPHKNIHIPNGTILLEEINSFCSQYEALIEAEGGLDFQLLGIGRTGHVGFNEPGSHPNSLTRSIILDHITRVDATSAFLELDNVPKKAITMGVGTIKKAKRVVLLAWGISKAKIIKETIEGLISSDVPATYLQQQSNTTFVLDQGAASELTRIKKPWIVGNCEWTENLKIRAICWLCSKVKKTLLELVDKDYNNNGMADLLFQEGSSYNLNIKIFNHLQHTITGWPGGKPNADGSTRPERATPEKKRVLIFSPHPDDDVISMGGTIDRLVEQGHDVHIAYQTSGSIAVNNKEALKYSEVCQELIKAIDSNGVDKLINSIKKQEGNIIDPPSLRNLKCIIREKEALAAVRFLSINETQVHFLRMPFYETGIAKKSKLAQTDIDLISQLIKEVKPHQIFAAGDLSDPHGTHKICLDALKFALTSLKNNSVIKDCWVWLYSGAWDEWKTHEIDMAVPLSPDQIIKKRHAIFFHQSQKDNIMFQGDDTREFWVRTEERNKKSALKYHTLGMVKYGAIETFKKMKLQE